jgi:MFS family permease
LRVPPSFLADFRILDRRVFILALARLIVTLGFAAVLPYLGVTLHQERGVPAHTVGLIWTVAGLSGAAMQWVAGEITDRIGRRRVLLGAMVLRTLNLAGLGYEILHQGPVSVIAALIVLNAVLRAFFDPVASAMVADLTTDESRIAAFSLQRIGVNIGWAAGTGSLALAAVFHIAFGRLFYVSAVVTLLATVAAATISETGTHHRREARPMRLADLTHYRHDHRFMVFLLGTFFFFLLQAQLYATLSLYAANHLHLGLVVISHFYILNGLMVVLLQIPAFHFIRRTGTRRVLVIGACAYALSYALCGAATREVHLLMCVGAITIAEIISAPAQHAAATGMAPPQRMGAYAGMFGLAQSLGQSFGPLVGTTLLDALPDRLTWPLLALCGVAAALLYRHRRPTPAPPQAA